MQNNRCIGPIHAVAEWSLHYYSDVHAIHTAWVRTPFVAFLVIFLLNYYFLFYFNKNNQCNVCKYKYYLTTHTHMSEVEVLFRQ